MKDTIEGMIEAEWSGAKRSCYDAPSTERKDQAQGRWRLRYGRCR
ncbi:MAG: hypothetical protein ABFC94_15080 [Syntrophomonas sp.]